MKNLWHEHCQRFLSPVYLRRRALFLIIIKNTRQIIRDATAERGTAALMMEWGINQGNDLFLYGEKVKAGLIRGARQLSGFARWPNPELGYGALCAADSLM